MFVYADIYLPGAPTTEVDTSFPKCNVSVGGVEALSEDGYRYRFETIHYVDVHEYQLIFNFERTVSMSGKISGGTDASHCVWRY